MKNIRRFTLVELLAVIALIVILSTLGFGVYSYAKGKARESATEALLKQIDAGLESFHTKNGYYPKSKNGNFSPIRFSLNSDGTVESVIFSDTDSGASTDKYTRLAYKEIDNNWDQNKKRKQRMENEQLKSFSQAMDMEVIKNNLNGDNDLVDAWGNKIYYRSPGEFKKGSYDLISAGADGAFGKNNTDEPTGALTIFRELAGEHVCDDIFTF